jgi:hypothetical protein
VTMLMLNHSIAVQTTAIETDCDWFCKRFIRHEDASHSMLILATIAARLCRLPAHGIGGKN